MFSVTPRRYYNSRVVHDATLTSALFDYSDRES